MLRLFETQQIIKVIYIVSKINRYHFDLAKLFHFYSIFLKLRKINEACIILKLDQFYSILIGICAFEQ